MAVRFCNDNFATVSPKRKLLTCWFSGPTLNDCILAYTNYNISLSTVGNPPCIDLICSRVGYTTHEATPLNTDATNIVVGENRILPSCSGRHDLVLTGLGNKEEGVVLLDELRRDEPVRISALCTGYRRLYSSKSMMECIFEAQALSIQLAR
jgi:hypothetical protein